MSAVDSVNAFITALEGREFASAGDQLGEDFLFSGWTPRPLDSSQFISIMSGLKEGIPNLTYHFQAAGGDRDRLELDTRVSGFVQVTGRQTDSFNLPALGLPPVPQMERTVSLPRERWDFTLQQDKILKIAVERVEGGGIAGLLQQLGINIPIIE